MPEITEVRIVVTDAGGNFEHNFTTPVTMFWETAEEIITEKGQYNLIGQIPSIVDYILGGDTVTIPLSLESNVPRIEFQPYSNF